MSWSAEDPWDGLEGADDDSPDAPAAFTPPGTLIVYRWASTKQPDGSDLIAQKRDGCILATVMHARKAVEVLVQQHDPTIAAIEAVDAEGRLILFYIVSDQPLTPPSLPSTQSPA